MGMNSPFFVEQGAVPVPNFKKYTETASFAVFYALFWYLSNSSMHTIVVEFFAFLIDTSLCSCRPIRILAAT